MTSPTDPLDTPQRETHHFRGETGSERAATSWGVRAALIGLSLIPVIAGSVRAPEITGGRQPLPANPRIDAVPAPLAVHIVTGEAVFGTSQLSTAASFSSGWFLNATAAERVIRLSSTPGRRRARRGDTHAAPEAAR